MMMVIDALKMNNVVVAARAMAAGIPKTDSSCGYDNVRPESIYKLAYNTVNRYIINR